MERGLSLIEILVALAVLAILGAWAVQHRPGFAAEAAAALRSQLLQARFEAISRNAPVAVVYDPDTESFLTRAGEAPTVSALCEQGEEILRLPLADYPRVRAVEVPPAGLVWLPSGSGRDCHGGGVYNQTIRLHDRVREARVVVSRAGRVRSEVDR